MTETFAGRIEFVVLDIDDRSLNDTRSRLGITGQAQYVLVNSAGEIVGRWFGIIDESRVTSQLEMFLQT